MMMQVNCIFIEHDTSKSKDIINTYTYDPEGNLSTEIKDGVGTGARHEDLAYTYDVLGRLIHTSEKYGTEERSYEYDSLGNLTYESSKNNKFIDYDFNILNQLVSKNVNSTGKDKKGLYTMIMMVGEIS